MPTDETGQVSPDSTAAPLSGDALQHWIDQVFDVLGWTRDPSTKLSKDDRSSPRHTYHEQARELKKAAKKTTDKDEKSDLLEKSQEASDRRTHLRDTEKDLSNRVKAVAKEVKDLNAEAEKKKLGKLDPKTIDREDFLFLEACRRLTSDADHALNQSFRVPVETDKGLTFETFALINKGENELMHGAAKAALLEFRLGKKDEARKRLEAAQKELVGFIEARTGATTARQKDTDTTPSLGGKAGDALRAARGWVEALRRTKLTAAADSLEKTVNAAETRMRTTLRQNQGIAWKDFDVLVQSDCGRLNERSEETRKALDQITQILEEGAKATETMRLNGYNNSADRREKALKKTRKTAEGTESLPDCIKLFESYLERVEEKAEEKRDKRLEKLKVDPEEVQKTIDSVAERFEGQFDLNTWQKFKDLVHPLKDYDTGERRDRKGNEALPRETANEMTMKLSSAKLLLQSGSAEAAVQAQDIIDEANRIMKALEKDPKVFEGLAKKISSFEEFLSEADKKYAPYEISERMQLRSRLKEITQHSNTQDPDRTEGELSELMKDFQAYLKKAKRVEEHTKAQKKELEEIAKAITAIEGMMKYPGIDPDYAKKKYPAYHGRFLTEMRQLESEVALGTEDSVTSAIPKIAALKKEVMEMKEIIRPKNVSDNWKPTKEEAKKRTDFFKDARTTLAAHEEQQRYKDLFKKEQSALEKDFKKLKKLLTGSKLEADPTEVDGRIQEVEGLGKEIKSSEQYKDGCARQKGLRATYNRMHTEATVAREIADDKLAEAAKQCAIQARGLKSCLKTFYTDGVMKAAGDVATLESAIGKKGPGLVQGYLKQLEAVLPDSLADDLERESAIVANPKNGEGPRKAARAKALAALRRLFSTMSAFPPMAKFLEQPFDVDTASYGSLRQSLPRLEIALLTAIKG